MSSLRERFTKQVQDLVVCNEEPQLVVMAVKLPTGAIETIINTQELTKKLIYYIDAYNEEFCLKTNPAVKIVGYMIV